MKPDAAASGPRPGVEHPRCEQPMRALRPKGRLSQSRLVCTTSRRRRRARDGRAGGRPSRRGRARGDHSSVPSTPKTSSARDLTSATPRARHRRHRRCGGRSSAAFRSVLVARNARLAVGVRRRGRVLGVQVLDAARLELGAELRVCRAPDPQRVPRAEDVVMEARPGDLRRLDRAPELGFALEDTDAPPGTESSAAHASELIPLPTTTASWSGPASFRNSSSVTSPRLLVPSSFTRREAPASRRPRDRGLARLP